MEIIKKQIGDFNNDLNTYSANINAISDATSAQLFGKLKEIFSRMQMLPIKEERVEPLAQVLLVNIKRHMNHIHSSLEVLVQSKPFKALLIAVEQEIAICIQSIQYDEQLNQSNPDIVNISERIVEPEIVEPESADVENMIELSDDVLAEFFDEIEEYLQLEIDVDVLTAETWEDVYEEYKNYIASIGKKQSQKIRNILQAQIKKSSGRYKNFITKVAEIMEQNIQKSDEQAQKEDDLRKLHDLRRDRLKRMRELDLIDLMYAKNQEFLKTVLTLIDSYVIDKHFPLTHNMKQHEESWDQFRIGLDTTIEQWKDYFVLNMYHKYSSFGLDEFFNALYVKLSDNVLDSTDFGFKQKYGHWKNNFLEYVGTSDTLLLLLYSEKKNLFDKICSELEPLDIVYGQEDHGEGKSSF